MVRVRVGVRIRVRVRVRVRARASARVRVRDRYRVIVFRECKMKLTANALNFFGRFEPILGLRDQKP